MTKNRFGHIANLIIPIAAGIFLRLYMLGDQIIIDDEWHGIGVASWRSYKDILTNFWFGGSSIPYDLYLKFTLNTIGWNEWIVRMPSIAAGILLLLIFPAVANKLFDGKTALISSLLLSISPLLIFYSRFERGYGPAVFLSFVAVSSLYFWLTTNKRLYQLCYIVCAPLTLYFHLFSIFAVIPPVLAAVTIKLVLPSTAKKETGILPPLSELIVTACAAILFTSVLLLPAYINSSAIFKLHAAAGFFVWSRFVGFLHLFSGTSNNILTFLFYSFFIAGSYFLIKINRLLGLLFLSMFTAYIIGFLVLRPDTMQISKVMARYSISLLPFMLIAAGLGANKFLSIATALLKQSGANLLSYVFAYSFAGFLLVAGPLSYTYTRPNNFTNHSAYQESYAQENITVPYVSEFEPIFKISSETVPLFYKEIKKEVGAFKILEYPVPISDYQDIQYYYQRLHKKRTVAGYFWDPLPSLKENVMYTNTVYKTELYHTGFFLNTANYDNKLNFKNMVNMKNIDAIRQIGVRYIVLHKNIRAEFQQLENFGLSIDAFILSLYYRKYFGNPVVDDKWLIVFKNSGLGG